MIAPHEMTLNCSLCVRRRPNRTKTLQWPRDGFAEQLSKVSLVLSTRTSSGMDGSNSSLSSFFPSCSIGGCRERLLSLDNLFFSWNITLPFSKSAPQSLGGLTRNMYEKDVPRIHCKPQQHIWLASFDVRCSICPYCWWAALCSCEHCSKDGQNLYRPLPPTGMHQLFHLLKFVWYFVYRSHSWFQAGCPGPTRQRFRASIALLSCCLGGSLVGYL